jgi:hypothetical protein
MEVHHHPEGKFAVAGGQLADLQQMNLITAHCKLKTAN